MPGRALGLAAVSALARLPGFLIPVLIAGLFGAGVHTDAYFVAYATALFVGGAVGQAVEVAIVPFAGQAVAAGNGAARAFLGTAARGGATVTLGLWCAAVVIAIAGVQPNLRADVAVYLACLTPLAPAWTAAAVYCGAHVSQHRIATATGSALWRGAGALAGLALAPAAFGLVGVAVGLSVGELTRVRWLERRFARAHTGDAGTPPRTSPFATAAVLTIVAGIVGGAPVLVERLLAAPLGPGAVSHLEYATRLLVVPAVLFDGALAPLMLARWSQHVVREGGMPAPRRVLGAVAKGVGLAALIAMAFVVAAELVVRLLLQHGRFTPADTESVTSVLRVLTLGFVGSMGALLVERVYLATARNRTMAVLSVLRAGVRIATAVALLASVGLQAFAWGFAAAEWTYLAALVIVLGQRTVRGGTA